MQPNTFQEHETKTSRLDRMEAARLTRYIKQGIDCFDDLTEWEQKFVRQQEIMFQELGQFMRVTQKQWEVWFRIMEKLGHESYQ